MKTFLGIDIGTSACKAMLVDENGQLLARTRIEYPTQHPQIGWQEQQPEDWVQAAIQAVRQIITPTDTQVLAIGLTGQMHSLVAVDARGNVLRPAILWSDTRNAAHVNALRANLGAQIRQWTANPVNGTMTLPTLLWLREREPRIWKETAWVLMAKDYVRYRLCGTLATDPSDAAGTLLFDAPHHVWSTQLIQALELPERILPPVHPSDSLAGRLRKTIAEQMGLREGIIVATGAADVACEMLAAGISESSIGLLRLGTAGTLGALMNEPVIPSGGATFYNHIRRDQWLVVTGTQACGSSLRWARDLLSARSDEELATMASGAPAGSAGVLFLPHLAGERAPYWNADLTGAFLGLALQHTKNHLARAVLEGVAFSLRDALNDAPEIENSVRMYRLLGGASANTLLAQILADVFQTPIAVLSSAEPALGAAMLASQVAGISGMVSPHQNETRTFMPILGNSQVYSDAFARYCQWHRSLFYR